MDNMKITMKNFIINYENNSFFDYDTKLELRFDEFSMMTTDINWKEKFYSN
jgi:hypothetical protein